MFGLGVYKTLLSSVPVFTKSKDKMFNTINIRDGPFDFSWGGGGGGGRIFESARFFFGPHQPRTIIFYRIFLI
jgi:hypothetical protein